MSSIVKLVVRQQAVVSLIAAAVLLVSPDTITGLPELYIVNLMLDTPPSDDFLKPTGPVAGFAVLLGAAALSDLAASWTLADVAAGDDSAGNAYWADQSVLRALVSVPVCLTGLLVNPARLTSPMMIQVVTALKHEVVFVFSFFSSVVWLMVFILCAGSRSQQRPSRKLRSD